MFSYERLIVYQKAFLVNSEVYRFIKNTSSIPGYMKNQLGRASSSIMLNIAEGSAKFSVKDRRNFYVTARGSAFECASIINFLFHEKEIEEDLRKSMVDVFDEISKILFSMIKNLDNNKLP